MKYILAIAIVTIALLFLLMLWGLCAAVRLNKEINKVDEEIIASLNVILESYDSDVKELEQKVERGEEDAD